MKWEINNDDDSISAIIFYYNSSFLLLVKTLSTALVCFRSKSPKSIKCDSHQNKPQYQFCVMGLLIFA